MSLYFTCACDHPRSWYDAKCRCCNARAVAAQPPESQAIEVLRELVRMNDDLTARRPRRDVTETWAWARSVLEGEATS